MVRVIDEEIPSGLFGERVTVCAIQLQCSFPNEMVIVDGSEYPRLAWLTDAIEKRRSKLITLLENIGKLERHIDIVILPEYSISEEMLEDLQNLSSKRNMTIIANYYESDSRKDITCIVLPTGKLFKQQKIIRSQYDMNVLTEVEESQKTLIRFSWNILSGKTQQKVFLQIFTCLDFLRYWAEAIDQENGGIVLVTMCSPNIEEFAATSKSLMRTEGSTGRHGSIATILCNAVESIQKPSTKIACGSSQLLGPFRGILPILDSEKEAGIIVDIRASNILKLPSPSTRENQVIESPIIFSISEKGKISFGENIRTRQLSETNLAVREEVFGLLGLIKYYGFSRVEDYYRHRPNIKRLPVQCNAIYGFHDILFQSYEESWDMCLLRVNSSLPMSTISAFKDPENLRVSHILKFRGTILNGNIPVDASKEYIQEHREQIRGLLLDNQVIEDKLQQEFLKRNILVRTALGYSDISEQETKAGLSEFLVLVFIMDVPFQRSIFDYFEEKVVSRLLNESSIRTIERCEYGGYSVERAHYIFHVVGTKKELQQVVIESIHKNASENDIKIGTRLIFPAEDLSSDNFCSLLETDTDIGKRKIIQNIISTNFREPDAFCVKRLALTELTKVCNIYDSAIKWFNHRRIHGTSESYIGDWDKYLGRFIYGITHSLVKDTNEIGARDRENIWEYCRNFYTRLAAEVEEILKTSLKEKIREIDNQAGKGKFGEVLQEIWDSKVRRKQEIKLSHITLGSLIQYIMIWNLHAAKYGYEENEIRDNSFTAKMRQLQAKKFAEFRDGFSHGKEGEGKDIQYMEMISDREDIIKLLDSAQMALDLLKNELGI